MEGRKAHAGGLVQISAVAILSRGWVGNGLPRKRSGSVLPPYVPLGWPGDTFGLHQGRLSELGCHGCVLVG